MRPIIIIFKLALSLGVSKKMLLCFRGSLRFGLTGAEMQ